MSTHGFPVRMSIFLETCIFFPLVSIVLDRVIDPIIRTCSSVLFTPSPLTYSSLLNLLLYLVRRRVEPHS
ncbi:hypothetical protein F5880DRAFT_528103 [Lentinula raphanica]|nr:hypothetical protein F5880DRAFT_528103 [Lentinula raphanica]